MAFPESFLQELKLRCDIEDVVSGYVTLKRRGSSTVGLCPFHSEKTPSFTIFTDNQSFYCFGCGSGGDVVTFIRKIENLDYVDAVKLLASKAGLPLPDDREISADSHQRREKILEINREAARFFHSCLISKENESILNYLAGRGLTMATIRRFGLGYSPNTWDSLMNSLKSTGFKREEIRSSSLGVVGKSGGLYDYFRGRVMFPILDVRGNVIAFGGRVLGDEQPKYLNSPDTPVFKKSQNLFALGLAKNKNNGRLILAEGYMDVIAMHQAGFTNAVATLGTAITPQQARLISRYAGEVVIAYDSDIAGQSATQKAISLLNETGVSVKVLKITSGKDPDEFIREYGADRFRLMIEGSENHIEYRLMTAMLKYKLDLPEEKASFLKEAVGILATLDSEIERDIYLSKLAREQDVTREALALETARIVKSRSKSSERQRQQKARSSMMGLRDEVNPEKAANLKAAKAEERLAGLLMNNPDYYDKVRKIFSPDDAVTSFGRKVLALLFEQLEQNGSVELVGLSTSLSPEEMGRISGVIASLREVSNNSDEIFQCIDVIKQEKQKSSRVQKAALEPQDAENYIKVLAQRKTKEAETHEPN